MEHDRSPLAAYVLGALADEEKQALDTHLAGCDECRAELTELTELEAMLGEVPPEAFLDGPPEGGDLLLQRTLRQVRKERVQAGRPRRLLVAAGIAGLVAAALAGGTLIGRGTAPAPQAGSGGTPTASAPAASPTASGVRTFAAKDPNTGASMTVTLTPAAGWVKLHVKAEGIKQGQRCVLTVVDKAGHHTQAGSWLVSANGEKNGTTLDGTALVAPADVASVDVVTMEGQTLVSVPA
jgi:predicted anti-sigma-YlaC factor YlaD